MLILGRKVLPSPSIFIILALLSYILADFLLNHTNYSFRQHTGLLVEDSTFSATRFKASSRSTSRAYESNDCQEREAFYETKGTEAENPWNQMKWIGEPARCKVKGHVIEKLDETNNFRRGFSLRFVSDVEDKTHILPWLLASRDSSVHRRQRRVYMDFGANRFSTSVLWFLRFYPCDFTEIHAFESHPKLFKKPKSGFMEEENWSETNTNATRVKRTPGVPQWMLDRIKSYNKYVSNADNEENRAINITRFMKEDLRLSAEDFVVVKMDIEGSEWPILSSWMQDGEMPRIVDELFVEVHYSHPSMVAYNWETFKPKSRNEAKRLLADLRWKGFYAHYWP